MRRGIDTSRLGFRLALVAGVAAIVFATTWLVAGSGPPVYTDAVTGVAQPRQLGKNPAPGRVLQMPTGTDQRAAYWTTIQTLPPGSVGQIPQITNTGTDTGWTAVTPNYEPAIPPGGPGLPICYTGTGTATVTSKGPCTFPTATSLALTTATPHNVSAGPGVAGTGTDAMRSDAVMHLGANYPAPGWLPFAQGTDTSTATGTGNSIVWRQGQESDIAGLTADLAAKEPTLPVGNVGQVLCTTGAGTGTSTSKTWCAQTTASLPSGSPGQIAQIGTQTTTGTGTGTGWQAVTPPFVYGTGTLSGTTNYIPKKTAGGWGDSVISEVDGAIRISPTTWGGLKLRLFDDTGGFVAGITNVTYDDLQIFAGDYTKRLDFGYRTTGGTFVQRMSLGQSALALNEARLSVRNTGVTGVEVRRNTSYHSDIGKVSFYGGSAGDQIAAELVGSHDAGGGPISGKMCMNISDGTGNGANVPAICATSNSVTMAHGTTDFDAMGTYFLANCESPCALRWKELADGPTWPATFTGTCSTGSDALLGEFYPNRSALENRRLWPAGAWLANLKVNTDAANHGAAIRIEVWDKEYGGSSTKWFDWTTDVFATTTATTIKKATNLAERIVATSPAHHIVFRLYATCSTSTLVTLSEGRIESPFVVDVPTRISDVEDLQSALDGKANPVTTRKFAIPASAFSRVGGGSSAGQLGSFPIEIVTLRDGSSDYAYSAVLTIPADYSSDLAVSVIWSPASTDSNAAHTPRWRLGYMTLADGTNISATLNSTSWIGDACGTRCTAGRVLKDTARSVSALSIGSSPYSIYFQRDGSAVTDTYVGSAYFIGLEFSYTSSL